MAVRKKPLAPSIERSTIRLVLGDANAMGNLLGTARLCATLRWYTVDRNSKSLSSDNLWIGYRTLGFPLSN